MTPPPNPSLTRGGGTTNQRYWRGAKLETVYR